MNMLHLAAFSDATFNGGAGNVTVPFIPESVLRAFQNQLQLDQDLDILAAFAGGAGLTAARLNSASLRTKGYPQLRSINNNELAGSRPGLYDSRDTPLRVTARENLMVQATNGGAQPTTVLVVFSQPGNPMNINVRGLRWVRFTSTATGVVESWSPVANIVFDDTLEAGIYKVYGMQVYEATCLAARLAFNNEVFRPGCVGSQLDTDIPHPMFDGGLGEWGSFDSITPPMLEVLSNTAGAMSVVGFLLIGK